MLIKPSLTDSSAPVREEDLKLPTLLVLAKAHQAKMDGLTSNDLVQALESISVLSDADRAVTPGDKIPRFRRQALNLISHGTLQKEGLMASRAPKVKEDGKIQRHYLTSTGRAALSKLLIQAIGMPSSARPMVSKESRTLEKAIAKPALFVLATLEMVMEGPVPMTTLRSALRSVLPKSEDDLAVLKNRTDTRIDQVIRNLISHNTLTKEGWVKRTDTGAMTITSAGYSVVLDSLLLSAPTPPMFNRPAPSLAQAVEQSAPAADEPEVAQVRRRANTRPR